MVIFDRDPPHATRYSIISFSMVLYPGHMEELSSSHFPTIQFLQYAKWHAVSHQKLDSGKACRSI